MRTFLVTFGGRWCRKPIYWDNWVKIKTSIWKDFNFKTNALWTLSKAFEHKRALSAQPQNAFVKCITSKMFEAQRYSYNHNVCTPCEMNVHVLSWLLTPSAAPFSPANTTSK